MTTLKCDHCDEELGADQRQMICVSVKSHVPDETGLAVPARVNTQRWWRFCDKACAEDWYAHPTDEHFMPMGPVPEPIPCEAHPEGEHDFAVQAEDVKVKAYALTDVTLSASPRCARCKKAPHEVQPAAPHLIDSGEQMDRLLRMVAVHVVPSEDPELCDHQIFDEPQDLNDYWKTAGPPVPMPPTGPAKES